MAATQSAPTQHLSDSSGRVFVKSDGHVTLACPRCNSLREVSVNQYRERQHRLKVRCNCSHVFTVNLDFRQAYRKPADLTGAYTIHAPGSGGGMANIRNLSQNGVCFEIKGVHNIKPQQRGRIDFTLDNRKKTRLIREFVVRNVSGKCIGCEFRKDQEFEKELGFYLRFGP